MANLPPENNPEQTRPKQRATDAICNKIDALSTNLTVINQANQDADAANQQTRDRCEAQREVRENRMFWLEVFGIIGLLIYCIFTGLEWRTFDSERQTMEKEFLAGETNVQRQLAVMQEQIEDARAAQRALLKFGEFTAKIVRKTTNEFSFTVYEPIKNVGNTPAIDLMGGGMSYWDTDATRKMNESFEKAGITNSSIKKFDRKHVPSPSPFRGDPFTGGTTITVQPQEMITNSIFTGGTTTDLSGTGYFYVEAWISYKDIFGRPWIIGEGGSFDSTNGTFACEFIYSQEYRDEGQTNSTSGKK
jgi:hypothetical protein